MIRILYLILVPVLLFAAGISCQQKYAVFSSSDFPVNDTAATPEIKNLYRNLHELSGKKVLIGHQDALAYGMGWKGDEFRTDIADVCGKFPAVFGWDLGMIGNDVNIDSVPFSEMKKWALKAYYKGGVNTYSWHMINLSTGGNSWDTTPTIMDILPGGENHEAFRVKLDEVAAFFGSLLKDDSTLIPVVFRPFHEMNGAWFWWGRSSCTPEEYKRLFRFTVDYLKNEKGLHNILYVYSTDAFSSSDEYLKYYPGDEYVDILGMDDYKGLNNRKSISLTISMLETLDSLAEARSKLFILSETGSERIPDAEWFTSTVLPALKANDETMNVSWILFWRNGRPDHFYAPYPGHSSAPDFKRFAEDPYTAFLDDVDLFGPTDTNGKQEN